MSTQLISHPFRLGADGSVVTQPDGSDEYLAEQLTLLVMTIPGEREQVPSFGMRDAAFEGLDYAMLTAQLALFGPPVNIASITVQQVSDGQAAIAIEFANTNTATV
jgi:phage baseplate assembly protein W